MDKENKEKHDSVKPSTVKSPSASNGYDASCEHSTSSSSVVPLVPQSSPSASCSSLSPVGKIVEKTHKRKPVSDLPAGPQKKVGAPATSPSTQNVLSVDRVQQAAIAATAAITATPTTTQTFSAPTPLSPLDLSPLSSFQSAQQVISPSSFFGDGINLDMAFPDDLSTFNGTSGTSGAFGTQNPPWSTSQLSDDDGFTSAQRIDGLSSPTPTPLVFPAPVAPSFGGMRAVPTPATYCSSSASSMGLTQLQRVPLYSVRQFNAGTDLYANYKQWEKWMTMTEQSLVPILVFAQHKNIPISIEVRAGEFVDDEDLKAFAEENKESKSGSNIERTGEPIDTCPPTSTGSLVECHHGDRLGASTPRAVAQLQQQCAVLTQFMSGFQTTLEQTAATAAKLQSLIDQPLDQQPRDLKMGNVTVDNSTPHMGQLRQAAPTSGCILTRVSQSPPFQPRTIEQSSQIPPAAKAFVTPSHPVRQVTLNPMLPCSPTKTSVEHPRLVPGSPPYSTPGVPIRIANIPNPYICQLPVFVVYRLKTKHKHLPHGLMAILTSWQGPKKVGEHQRRATGNVHILANQRDWPDWVGLAKKSGKSIAETLFEFTRRTENIHSIWKKFCEATRKTLSDSQSDLFDPVEAYTPDNGIKIKRTRKGGQSDRKITHVKKQRSSTQSWFVVDPRYHQLGTRSGESQFKEGIPWPKFHDSATIFPVPNYVPGSEEFSIRAPHARQQYRT